LSRFSDKMRTNFGRVAGQGARRYDEFGIGY
jgi:hypothetical protein